MKGYYVRSNTDDAYFCKWCVYASAYTKDSEGNKFQHNYEGNKFEL